MISQNKKKESEIPILLEVMVEVPFTLIRNINLTVLCEETLNSKNRTKEYKDRLCDIQNHKNRKRSLRGLHKNSNPPHVLPVGQLHVDIPNLLCLAISNTPAVVIPSFSSATSYDA